MDLYPVAGIRSTVKEWQECIKVFLKQRTGKSINAETGIGNNRAVRMVNVLRVCMEVDTPNVFKGAVEMDETYIGGQRKNKKLHIRRIKAKKGHGTEKLPIIGIFDRDSKQVYVEVMSKKLSMNHIIKTMHARVETGAEVLTDGYKMYRGLKIEKFQHEYVNHHLGEYVREHVHTNNIEGFWGILKRKLSCIGGMRRDRLHLFVAEIAWKFNHRNLSIYEQENRLLKLVIKFGGRS
jgi:transposase-like protein